MAVVHHGAPHHWISSDGKRSLIFNNVNSYIWLTVTELQHKRDRQITISWRMIGNGVVRGVGIPTLHKRTYPWRLMTDDQRSICPSEAPKTCESTFQLNHTGRYICSELATGDTCLYYRILCILLWTGLCIIIGIGLMYFCHWLHRSISIILLCICRESLRTKTLTLIRFNV